MIQGLPWWCSGQESACRGHRFEPWSRKIPRAAEQLSLCTTTTKPALFSLSSLNQCCNRLRPFLEDPS